MKKIYTLRSLKVTLDKNLKTSNKGEKYFREVTFTQSRKAKAAFKRRKFLLGLCCKHYRVVLLVNDKVIKEYQNY